MTDNLIILGEVVVSQKNSFKTVKRYIKGKHPESGVLHVGLSGDWETICETSVLTPIGIKNVVNNQEAN